MYLSTFFYIFFAIGLSNFSKILFKEVLYKKDKLNLFPIPILPILTFITLLVFCVFTNFSLLLPYLCQTLNFPTEYINKLSFFLKKILEITTYLFSIFGIYDFLNLLTKKYRGFKSKQLNNSLYISLIVSFLIYFFLAPKSAELITFDTGLYHYPIVKYLSEFGIEKGIGNFYLGYGIYNLNLFGQVPFHNLFKTSEYLAPSLNIIFLSLYIWFFIEEFIAFRKNKNQLNILKIPYKFIVLLYFCISCIFCSSNLITQIASYSPHISIFVAGSLTFYIIFSSSLLGERYYSYIAVFLISIFAPLLKISAVSIGILNLTYLCIFIIKNNHLKKIKIFNSQNFLIYCFNCWEKLKVLKYSILILIICYCITLITNIIWSGYMLFPSTFLGPIGEHAMNKNVLNGFKDITLSWHRYSGEIPLNGFSTNIFIWFPYFINSRNGLIVILYWILPNIFSLIINNFKFFKKKIYSSSNQINLNNHVLVISIFTLLNVIFLITAPSYTPWLTPVIIFLSVITLCSILSKNSLILKFQKFTIISSFTLLIISSIKFSYGNQVIIKNLFKNPFLTKFPILEYKTVKYKPKNWEPKVINKDLKVDINVSSIDQCWNIPAPCITKYNYENKLK